MIFVVDFEKSKALYPCLCRKHYFLSRAHLLWWAIHSLLWSERSVLRLHKMGLSVVLGQPDVSEIALPSLGATGACRHTKHRAEGAGAV